MSAARNGRVARSSGIRLTAVLIGALLLLASPGPSAAQSEPTCPCTLWADTVVPSTASASDTGAVELGVKFRTDAPGFVTAIRFYKGPLNTGTHVGSLWTADGTLLARATFTDETATGWQQVTLPTPVAIQADTIYVVSYFAPAGGYAFTANYFASTGVDSGPLHALASTVSPNGVFRYGSSSSFPDQSYQASNYWMDVVFTTESPDTTPPTIVDLSPAEGSSDVGTFTAVKATFSEALAPASVVPGVVELRTSSGTVVPGSLDYDDATRAVTFTPSTALAPSTTYVATVRGGASSPRVTDLAGNPLDADVTWSFTTGVAPDPPCPCTIWTASSTREVPSSPDTNAVELGVKFRSDLDGYITALRFYKGPSNTGPHVGSLWTATGTLLGRTTFTAETGSGWQEAPLPVPVPVTAGVTYVASYFAPNGGYAFTPAHFATAGVDRGPLHALANPTSPNGVFRYGPSSAFPDQTFNASNYWVDVVFVTTAPGPPDTTPPTVVAVSPSEGATGVPVGTAVTATFSEAMDPSTISTATFELRSASGELVAATVAYDAVTRRAALTPAATLAPGASYTATVRGGTVDPRVRDVAGNAMAASFSWSFSTATGAPPGLACPCTIWSASATPAVPSEADPSPVEVGVKFRSDVDGYITALRFYKGPANPGPHVARLWTSTGQLLASATFTAETASGWQQVALPTAVPITAGTTYVASYFAPAGGYAVTEGYFAQGGVDNPPLHALATTVSPNGVYRYGPSGGFPIETFEASNYWVDVVFDTSPGGSPDTTPPTVVAMSPPPGASGTDPERTVTVRFSEPMAPESLSTSTVQLRPAGGNPVSATVTYEADTLTATLTPEAPLAPSTTYSVTVRGGAVDPRVKDVAGNALAANVTWSFNTASDAEPLPPDQGPGGPVLIVTSPDNPFTAYYAEILRAEGLNLFTVAEIDTVTPGLLNAHDVVILGEMPLSPAQVTMLSDWVTAGGNLIAMRPDKQLTPLLGLADTGATLANAYLRVDTAAPPGAGIVGETIQFKGTADLYTLDAGTTAVATLYSTATTATASPAVTVRSVGPLGGRAVAFTYDLARSIVYLRQGNPDWAGDERDGVPPVRSDDLFFGAADGDPQPDWVDLDKIAIPQADEQQRLLVNLLLHVNTGRKPLPRFWYFPRVLKAVVVLTGDDHANGGTAGRFARHEAASPPGCSVDNWECVRSTSYVFPTTPLPDATAAYYHARGFEIGLHVNTGCADFTPASLEAFYAGQLAAFAAAYPSLPSPTTSRTHCIVWSDWSTQPKVELSHGIGLDTNYYYWPPAWVGDRPGFFTGSGLPMRFADTDGTLIDVYQAATQMTDESGQTFPFTIDTLLDRALGPEGYYGAFVANMHTDAEDSPGATAIVASAQARGVPVISARQLLDWLDGRGASSFSGLGWDGNRLSFSVNVGVGANGLQVVLPATWNGAPVTGVTLDDAPVAFEQQTLRGVSWVTFPAVPGLYRVTYGTP